MSPRSELSELSELNEGGAAEGFNRLVAVMARLRDPVEGCPWDLAQSLDSLKPYLVEEAHETLDAIDALGAAARANGARPGVTDAVDPDLIADHREELGDLLLQVAFQSRLAEEFGWFTADDVAHGIADKMTRRHPHVFAPRAEASGEVGENDEGSEGGESSEGAASRLTADDVATSWRQIKAREQKIARKTGILAGVPRQLPALLRAQRIGAKAAHVGFDWPDRRGALAKVDEELRELHEAIASEDRVEIEHELGDLLFALTSVARHVGVDAEQALRTTLDRFQRRFAGVERELNAHQAAHHDGGETPPDLATLERWWLAAKAAERAEKAAAPAPPSPED